MLAMRSCHTDQTCDASGLDRAVENGGHHRELIGETPGIPI
jgi:hypothetical protein